MSTPTRPLALVTGASSGIGRELAEQFAEHGFDVVVTAEDAELQEAAQALTRHGGLVVPVRADLTSYDDVERLAAEVTALGRPVDALALNAGVGVGGDFVATDLAAELRIVALNCGSTVHLAKRVVPGMVARGEGRVLVTSSIASLVPQPYQAVYGASKAFAQSFALALREELKDTGVTVTALLPGPTDTEFFEGPGFEGTKLGETSAKDDPAQVARQGFEGLMKGEQQVRAGSLTSKVAGKLSELTPNSVAQKMQKRLTGPGSAE